MDLLDGADAVMHRFRFENIQVRVGGCAGNGIGRIGVPVKEGSTAVRESEGLPNLARRERGRQWQESTGQAFGQIHEVRSYICEPHKQTSFRTRPKPVRTSSVISRTLCSFDSCRMPWRNSTG